MAKIELSPFAQRYLEELKSLVNTDRKTISFLRTLAAENHQQEKLHIVVALQQYLYYHCAPQQQLPLLYLVDCILKTVTEHYLAPLCPPLPSMFLYVWRTNPSIHPALTKLAKTWRAFLPPQTQAQIDQVVASESPAPSSVSPTATPPHVDTAYAAPLYQRPASSGPDPRLAVMQQQNTLQQQQLPQQALQQSLFSMQPAALPQLQPQLQPASLLGGLGAPAVGTSYGSHLTTPAVAAPVQQYPVQHVQQPVYNGQLQQPQQFHSEQTPHPSHASIAGPSPSSVDIMAALQSLVGSMGSAGSAGPRTSDGGAALPGPPASHSGRVSSSCTFSPSRLKEYDQSAIDALMTASDKTRTAFLDQRFLRTRRIRAAQQAGLKPSQRWYYTVDQWLLGASSQEQDTANHWVDPEEEAAAAAKAEAEAQVEEDPSQPECAISGEPFERTYDPDTDKWYYQGAVVLTGEAAARHGVMDGSIVKVQALAGQPTKLGQAAKGLGQKAAAVAAANAFQAAGVSMTVAELKALAAAGAAPATLAAAAASDYADIAPSSGQVPSASPVASPFAPQQPPDRSPNAAMPSPHTDEQPQPQPQPQLPDLPTGAGHSTGSGLEGCAVAALRLEPHSAVSVPVTAQNHPLVKMEELADVGAQGQGAAAKRALHDASEGLTAAAAAGPGHDLHATKKIKLESN